MCGKEIERFIEEAVGACIDIKDAGGCGSCPMHSSCIEEELFVDMVSVSSEKWEEFMGFAEDCRNYTSEEDAVAHFADQARKMERDEFYD